jgi:pentatricopeptide repeat protein
LEAETDEDEAEDGPVRDAKDGGGAEARRAGPGRRRKAAAKSPRPDVISYTSAIEACAEAAQAERALALLQRMRQRGGVTPNAITYSAALKVSNDVSHKDLASEALRSS